jgi:hypothetical protein
MSNTEEINKLITNITGVVEAEVCEKIPAMIEQKSQQIFDQVIAILTTKREQIREVMMSEFKKSINNEIMNDQSVKDMLVAILKEGTQKIFDVKTVDTKKGGKRITRRRHYKSSDMQQKNRRITLKI